MGKWRNAQSYINDGRANPIKISNFIKSNQPAKRTVLSKMRFREYSWKFLRNRMVL